MGNDGGSIPDRRDLVRSKPKVRQHVARIWFLQLTRITGRASGQSESSPSGVVLLCTVQGQLSLLHNFTLSLTYIPLQKALREPIVSCALGKLYNKDAVLEYLLDKTAYGDGEEICGHIRTLKVRPLPRCY